MVIFGGMARFYSRNSTGKYPMDYSEIRSAFVESTDIGERLRGFRMARVRQILAGETLLGTILAPIVALHLIPLSSLGLGAAPDVSREAAKAQVLLQPIRAGSWGGHFNFDGYLVRSTTARSYVQVFRSGAIEAGDASLLDIKQPGYEKQIPSIAFEATIIECLQRYVDVQRRLAIQLPVFMTITLLRIKGFTMSSTYSFLEKNPPIDRETLPLPEVVVEDYAANVGKLLQPSFDALWQACGLEKSRNYDDAGNWRAHRC